MYMYMYMKYIHIYYTPLLYVICPLYIYIYTRKIRSILQKPKISPQPDPSSVRKATLDLASLYAFCWQSLERAERSMDSERLLCVAQMLCRWIETARVVEGSGELPAFRFFCWDFLENHRVYAELWRRIWNIPHNDWLGYGIKIWIETIVACMSTIHDCSIW